MLEPTERHHGKPHVPEEYPARLSFPFRVVRKDPACPVVAVSGLHQGQNPQPGSAVVAALRRANPRLRVVGLAYDSLESGLYSQGDDALDAVYTMPFPSAGRAVWLERLAEVHRRERLDVLMPCLDAEVELAAGAGEWLAAARIAALLPAAESFARRDTACLEALACDAGCPTAQAQGIAGERFNVAGLGDGDGGMTAHCAIRQMLPGGSGTGFAGIVVNDARLLGRAQALIRTLEWRGPFEMEFVADAAQRDVRLVKFNPRFPAWVGFPASLGCNLPALALDLALGRPARPVATCTPGEFFLRHSVDVTGNLSQLVALATSGMLSRDADARGDVSAHLAAIASARPRAERTL